MPGRVSGRDGPATMNCARLLDTCWIDTLRFPLLVNTRTAGELKELTLTEPKFQEVGLTPTPATAGEAERPQTIRRTKTPEHTHPFLFMRFPILWRRDLDAVNRIQFGSGTTRGRGGSMLSTFPWSGYVIHGAQTTGLRSSFGIGTLRYFGDNECAVRSGFCWDHSRCPACGSYILNLDGSTGRFLGSGTYTYCTENSVRPPLQESLPWNE